MKFGKHWKKSRDPGLVDPPIPRAAARGAYPVSAVVRHGMHCQEIDEAWPKRNSGAVMAACEVVIPGRNNASITLGRDRPERKNSGYGGKGATQCGMIDIVTGRASSFKTRDGRVGPPADIETQPNFFLDASRIYISQKCDIDAYFGLDAPKKVKSRGKAGIGIKSDCVRIIGRENVIISTGQAKVAGADSNGETNASGGKLKGNPGKIYLMAGNNDGEVDVQYGNPVAQLAEFLLNPKTVKHVQPIPRGYNLSKALEEIMELLNDVATLVFTNSRGIQELSTSVATHFHDYGGGFGPTTPSSYAATKLIPTFTKSVTNSVSNTSFTTKTVMWETNFINKRGRMYINSKNVFST